MSDERNISRDDIFMLLSNHPYFRSLEDEELRAILKCTERRRYRDGETVTDPAKAALGAYLLLNGHLRDEQSMTPDTEWRHPGTLIGGRFMLSEGRWPRRLIADGAVDILAIRRSELIHTMRLSPTLAATLGRDAGTSLAQANQNIIGDLISVLGLTPSQTKTPTETKS